ncbi:MAG: AhpC/TSA family protein [Tannerellaceae bacterium]|jgi:thiol-disulfide isomerase/thioredoxin|nr:AhpC/TSA family protein [Tannerellaceae bacterium]
MKNCIYLFLIALAALSGCKTAPGFTINGKVANPDLDGKYVYLSDFGAQTPRDSALVAKGTFTFKGVQEQPVVAILKFGQGVIERGPEIYEGFHSHQAFLLLDNSRLKVVLDVRPTVGGSAENDALNAYMQKLDAHYAPHVAEINGMLTSGEPSVVLAGEEHLEELQEAAEAIHREYISAQPNSILAAFVLHINRYGLSEALMRELVAGAGETFKAVPEIQKIADRLAVLEKVGIGKTFTDFEMPDPKGVSHKLSEYVAKNKLLLVDFWASWCGPCRRSMPHLKELYAQYHSKGFEILGVSFDRTHEAWVKGIADLELPWPQISDIKYWQCEAGVIYGVNSIPHTLLIDGNGLIVDKNLHGEELDNRIAALLQ